MKKITVLGAGAWGSAMATLLAHNGHDVTLWCFEQSVVDDIITHQINKAYLPGIELSKKIHATTSLHEALEGADFIFEAIPVLFLRSLLEQARPYVSPDAAWVMLSKGIEADSLLFPSQIVGDVLSDMPPIAVLSGPNFADQVAQKRQSATCIASIDKALAQEIAQLCATDYFTPTLSSDVIGVQIGGALKNCISLALGIAKGDGAKENELASLLTKGFGELMTCVTHYGGTIETACGLSGFGDLMLGLIGERKNRNYRLGILLGEGNSFADISAMMKVLPEGVNALKSLDQLCKRDGLVLPLCQNAHRVTNP